jgi:hypothetical protein
MELAIIDSHAADRSQGAWRFRITSYKLVPQSSYVDVLAFLDKWANT